MYLWFIIKRKNIMNAKNFTKGQTVELFARFYTVQKVTAKTVTVLPLDCYSTKTRLIRGNDLSRLQVVEFETLTRENMDRVQLVLSKSNPEWGTKYFSQDKSGNGYHSFGQGVNSALLFEDQFKHWYVASWKGE